MANALTSFRGETLYLDTMCPYLLLRGADDSVKHLFARIQAGEILAYTSVLTFDELGYRILLALIKDKYDGSPLDRLRDKEQELLTEFAPKISDLLERRQQFPSRTLVDVLVSDLSVMQDGMRQYHLRPRDALHYASMKRVGCTNLASTDADFDRIPNLNRYMV